jgi:hypothetical protein
MPEATMDANTKRVHYYHADASALGGSLQRPVAQIVPVQAPSSLAPVGGYGSAQVGEFQIEGILSFTSASTQVAGSVSKENGAWTTLVTATVEGLNVGEILAADRMVAQISTEHPLVGYQPKVNFVGTKFENLRIAGSPITPVLNLDLCSQGQTNTAGYPVAACVDDPEFVNAVGAQYNQITNANSLPDWVTDRQIPAWVQQQYHWNTSQPNVAQKGSIVCSLVEEITGEFPGTPFGHVLEVPGFGKVFLAELVVDRNSYQLTMVRLELGSPVQGQFSMATGKGNGTTAP